MKVRSIEIDGVRLKYTGYTGTIEGDQLDVEYNDAVCNELLGCTDVVHEGVDHLRAALRNRYRDLQPSLEVHAETARVVYSTHGDTLYLRATRVGGKWTLRSA
jgi:hypothetical protein